MTTHIEILCHEYTQLLHLILDSILKLNIQVNTVKKYNCLVSPQNMPHLILRFGKENNTQLLEIE